MEASDQRARQAESTGPAFECFIDKPELGRRLGVSVRTVEEWMSYGLVPYYKVGSTVRFKWSDVERHLDQRCRVAPRNPLIRL